LAQIGPKGKKWIELNWKRSPGNGEAEENYESCEKGDISP